MIATLNSQTKMIHDRVSTLPNEVTEGLVQSSSVTSILDGIESINTHIDSLREELKSGANLVTPPFLTRAQDSTMDQALQAHCKSTIHSRNALKRRGKKEATFYHSVHFTPFGKLYFGTHFSSTITSVEEDIVERDEANSVVTYHPANWLISLGLTFRMNFSFRAPCPPISPARAVPDDALIFDLCWRGNVDAVRLVFDRREASFRDVNSNGETPLHVSTSPLEIEAPFPK